MQRTKLGWVLCSVVISLPRDSLYSWPTVRNMPFLDFVELGAELSDILVMVSRPTTRSTDNVVKHREHQFIFELFGFGELHVTRVGVQQLVHKGNISGFGEPALLIQQGQDAWWVVLQDESKHMDAI
ncbi:hypothetical protein INR49_019076 [Caranx melampygus]|nr:hypothetical protein INR49_019076 [Caranx melampygus]